MHQVNIQRLRPYTSKTARVVLLTDKVWVMTFIQLWMFAGRSMVRVRMGYENEIH